MFVVGGESLIDLVSAPVGPDGVIHMTAHQGLALQLRAGVSQARQ